MHEFINKLIAKHGYTRYLEIGIGQGNTFKRVRCDSKYACDPRQVDVANEDTSEATAYYWCQSDTFFTLLPDNVSFDIVFIDGHHISEQVTRDVANALMFLRPGGTIIVHDVNPSREEHAGRYQVPGFTAWNGDVWRAWVSIVRANPEARTIMQGHGLGVMECIENPGAVCVPLPDMDMPWKFFDANRRLILRPADSLF